MRTDVELQRDVLDALKHEPIVNAAHVGVAVKDGVVTLTGHVQSYMEKWATEEAAKGVDGVRGLANELDVRLPGEKRRTDQDIAAACVRALEFNEEELGARIKCVVRNGWVTLEGELATPRQKLAAEHAVRPLTGVVGVTNDIRVRACVSPAEVKARIAEALRRQATLEAEAIGVEVDGGVVILRGSVRARIEREEAERAARALPGVLTVEDYLTVEP